MFTFDFCLIFHGQIHTLVSITEKIKYWWASDAELLSTSSWKKIKTSKINTTENFCYNFCYNRNWTRRIGLFKLIFFVCVVSYKNFFSVKLAPNWINTIMKVRFTDETRATHFTRASKIGSTHNISMVNPLKQPTKLKFEKLVKFRP